MALSFLYVAFVRILQLIRLAGRDSQELVIEVVMHLWVPRMSSERLKQPVCTRE